MLKTLETNHDHAHAENRFAVIPTADKLGVDDRHSGRGVRIAFLDSGFYPHPDFIDRVVAFHDISGEDHSLSRIFTARPVHWHGTQTVTACAGDGCLSNGIYRGIACDAELVLVKVSRNGRIGDREIEEGLQWIIDKHAEYRIRILNISLGGDCDVPTADSRINALVEELVKSGVVVTVAAGNSAERRSGPPASSPSVITIGGYSDRNQFRRESFDLYNSSYGDTADGLVKPELIAPAFYVAAPIVPGTSDYETAEILSMLSAAPDYSLRSLVDEFWDAAGLRVDVVGMDEDSVRHAIDGALRQRKIVSTHYQHVDGTSFAAPIVASVVAQMLEANPDLTPAGVKNILISSASRLAGHPAIRQGFGVINARLAVEMAEQENHTLDITNLHPPRIVGRKIVFRYHADAATSVSLSGDLTDWEHIALRQGADGIWEAAVECRPVGRYRYKFLLDKVHWVEDPSHGLKEDDGFGGFNSVLVVGQQV